ncbi:cytochrome P450 [Aspergillus saccharolyticus JOP 1030-1]|uniref:Putative cytochrome P450 oxidoreductase OrdA-like protein n=1 Tax=Aspergillus saccharolyticus JOP 1030-1 TaxID=1450539 RepID=A0A318ZEN7_9EURO|nr:putative cytochrome P450 oxidoreductase OrdA-like protein [Aspergillus saccharolyticus JOP 1030-1]PYH45575.1 putative cytochrome P450 oxidoreductase OrdA-like protein [Aspergillus saccharolyticus JOP 1030-1]
MYILSGLIGLLGLSLLLKVLLSPRKPSAPLPPGPLPLPLVGNLRDLPAPDSPDWLHWLKHKDVYGPISTVTVLGQRLIILNDAKLALELLEKRSAVHSDRPKMPFAELAGWGDGLVILPYASKFKAYRKHLHREIGSKASIARFHALQEVETRRFLFRLINTPEELVGHIRKLAGAVILKIAYGYAVDPFQRDPLVDLADEAVEQFSLAVRPGTWMVDVLPFLRYLPAWFPGAGFQRTAQRFRKQSEAVADIPFAFVHHQMSQPGYESSYLSSLLENKVLPPGTPEETVIKWSAATLYSAGADTTVSTTTTFFLAMALYPDVQRKAQEEIDRVIGPGRLPVDADRANLPYIEAIVKEALRWHPVGPMGIPHRSMEDDLCEGYLIPKGSILLPNIWAFCHDPTEYKDPMSFNPDRFLGPAPERDPHSLAFGFGRRVCPGRTLADANIFLTVAQTLASCRIEKAIRNGQEVEVRAEFLPGTISHPAPFEVHVTPRTAAWERLIRAVETESPWETSHAEWLRRAVFKSVDS